MKKKRATNLEKPYASEDEKIKMTRVSGKIEILHWDEIEPAVGSEQGEERQDTLDPSAPPPMNTMQEEPTTNIIDEYFGQMPDSRVVL